MYFSQSISIIYLNFQAMVEGYIFNSVGTFEVSYPILHYKISKYKQKVILSLISKQLQSCVYLVLCVC